MPDDRPDPPLGATEPEPQAKPHMGLRRAFLTGLAALLPTALSVGILVWIFGFINDKVADPINEFIIWIMGLAGVEHAGAVFRHQEVEIGGEMARLGIIDFSFAGYVVAFAAVFFVGLVLLTLFGRRLYRVIDRVLSRMPVLRMVYPHIKQLTEFVFSSDTVSSFRRVVMIEYPRKGVWSLGFLTGASLSDASASTGRDLVSVFVPSSPTPFTGYVVAVPREEVITMPITVDEALRFTISGGVLVPPRQRVGPDPRGAETRPGPGADPGGAPTEH